jgi:predicted O-linked N-acetylglucosamine transferase (SPINDLY family)
MSQPITEPAGGAPTSPHDEALALAKSALESICDGDADWGGELIDQAFAVAEHNPVALERLAALFDGTARHADAARAAEAALALEPAAPNRTRPPQVGACCCAPPAAPLNRPALWATLGRARLELGEFDAADMAFQEAYRDAAPDAGTLTEIAQRFRRGRCVGSARHWIERALAAEPTDVQVVQESARIHTTAGDGRNAIETYDKALGLEPPDIVKAQIWAEKGITFVNHAALELAVAAFEKSLDLRPQDKQTLVQLATVLYRLGRRQEALKHFAAADWLDPEDPAVLSYLVHCRLLACDWAGLDAAVERLQQTIDHEDRVERFGTFMIFGLLNTPIDATRRLKVARAMSRNAWNQANLAAPPQRTTFTHRPGLRPRLRIGYLSASYREHSVATVFRHVLARHDRDAFEFHAYYVSHIEDEQTAEFRARFDHFHDIVHDENAARRIADDGIDILVDMEGLMLGHRLGVLAQRPAPIQAHWLGYGNSVGADYIDYLLTDAVSVPLAEAGMVQEKLVHLPGSFMPVALDPADPLAPRRADYGLPEDGMVFANFNEHYKIEPTIFAVWMRLLQQLPDAVLWLIEGQREAQGNLRRAAAAHGIDPARLVFSPRVSRPRHLARIGLADLGLETLYHVGGVTTADCLVAGLPVLTISGNNANARTSASLVSAGGVPELAVADIAVYEATALALAGDRGRLAGYRATLAARSGILFDSAAAARGLEAAYRAMWDIYEAGEAPRHIDVSGRAT